MKEKNLKALHPALAAFMYLLSFVALGFTAFAIGNILFLLINKYIADPFAEYDYWGLDSVKFSIASLIITTPVYIVLTNLIQKYTQNGRINLKSQIRKWLSYVIILITSVTIIGELIALIVNFLDGEITLRSFSKLMVVVGISVLIMLYHIFDTKRHEIPKKNTLRLVFNLVIIPLSIITLGLGIFMMEPPSQARYRKIDEKTLEKLESVKNNITYYHKYEKNLPTNLETLKSYGEYGYYYENYNTIDKDHQIQYNITEGNSFELCADFYLDSEAIQKYSNSYLKDSYQHDNGYQCFEFNASDEKNIEPIMIR